MNKQRLLELAGMRNLSEDDGGPWLVVSLEDSYMYVEGPFSTPSAAHDYRKRWLEEAGGDEDTTQVVVLNAPTLP